MVKDADIDTFDQHGHQFWDEKGPYRTLHEINPARLAFIRRYIDPAHTTMLDIGCGGGILAESLTQAGAKVHGIDLSASVLEAAKTHAAEQMLEIDYRQCSSSDCVANDEQYDHITCMEMLEHVVDPAAVIRDIATLLKPGGYAFFSTLNRGLKSWLGAIVAAEYLTGIVPRGTHRHDWFITPAELTNMSNHAGLTPVALCGLDYHPLLQRANLSRNLDINYLLAVRKAQH
ncbi:bifunctional 2-polyprenyl-6-hydroxyphenol methylase/3-demethylubiquinol 3-O-methyltransferase UbiG [Suttonella sp. R2A3]|uniref:bifunctional 2-polyprenyl-6-hydroxyphenol methylase/3-demethylubiquinol 3-O-methyltransferase UbiG n=1 Tax=Suttonella sp. R2A3 TaxID=2908648 RepID=UPI001F3222AF|nr:bifunctional 2-polyprenyl-6-hydroxyphenol methylase/3-demethylubiquinol 3-O-methyltransferase UbiG [Suttonella sp. R2A3]